MKNLTADLLNGYVNGLECEAKKAVFEILSLEDIETVFEYGCSAGVGGFTYYHETEKFFNEYPDEILECLHEFIGNCGGSIPSGFELTRNNLTWLFVEETVREMVYDLELE